MSIRIVTDSTCDLPPALAEQYGIVVLPCYINIGERSYLDGVNLSREEFYTNLPTYSPLPTTAAPGIEMFREAYVRLAQEGATHVLSIHLASSLSALLNVALIAARETTEVPVTVFDSRQLSLGLGFQALTAARAAAQGRSVAEIVALLNDQVMRTHIFAVLDTLENLRRSGRVSRLVAELGTLLQVKPLLHVYDGQVSAERIRTRKAAMEKMLEQIQQLGRLEEMAIVHARTPERAQELKAQMQQLYPDLNISICAEITPIIGTHVGIGAVGVICVQAKQHGEIEQ